MRLAADIKELGVCATVKGTGLANSPSISCDYCERENRTVLLFDTSDREYAVGFVCRQCVNEMFHAYPVAAHKR